MSHAGKAWRSLSRGCSLRWQSPGRSPRPCRCVWFRPPGSSRWSRSERGHPRSPAWCLSSHRHPARDKHFGRICTHRLSVMTSCFTDSYHQVLEEVIRMLPSLRRIGTTWHILCVFYKQFNLNFILLNFNIKRMNKIWASKDRTYKSVVAPCKV